MDHKQLQAELQRALYRLGRAHLEGAEGPLTRMEAYTLGLVRRLRAEDQTEGVCVSQLARASHVSSPAISRTLGQLEDKGLIRRMARRSDRRTTCVELTHEGETALEECMARNQELVKRVVERMGEDNVRGLARQLDLLCDIILEERSRSSQQT